MHMFVKAQVKTTNKLLLQVFLFVNFLCANYRWVGILHREMIFSQTGPLNTFGIKLRKKDNNYAGPLFQLVF